MVMSPRAHCEILTVDFPPSPTLFREYEWSGAPQKVAGLLSITHNDRIFSELVINHVRPYLNSL